MNNKADYLDWHKAISNNNDKCALGDDIILLDKPIIPKDYYETPFKLNVVVGIICIKGSIGGFTNLQPYKLEGPCLYIVMPDMVLEFGYMSDDFDGRFILISKEFLSDMRFETSSEAIINITRRSFIPLQQEEMDATMLFFRMVKSVIEHSENPYQRKIISLLTQAFFYGAGYYLYKFEQKNLKTKNETLFVQFMDLVQTHFAEQRGVEFYAEKLNLTPKYMSTVIKHASGKSAGEWIDDRIILEARAMLKSSNLTIQQIADNLNFPEQSAFGKFFKRNTGVSPKNYRKGN